MRALFSIVLFFCIHICGGQTKIGIDNNHLGDVLTQTGSFYVDSLYHIPKGFKVKPLVASTGELTKLEIFPYETLKSSRYTTKKEVYDIVNFIQKQYDIDLKWERAGDFNLGSFVWRGTRNILFSQDSISHYYTLEVEVLRYRDEYEPYGYFYVVRYIDEDLLQEYMDNRKKRKNKKR